MIRKCSKSDLKEFQPISQLPVCFFLFATKLGIITIHLNTATLFLYVTVTNGRFLICDRGKAHKRHHLNSNLFWSKLKAFWQTSVHNRKVCWFYKMMVVNTRIHSFRQLPSFFFLKYYIYKRVLNHRLSVINFKCIFYAHHIDIYRESHKDNATTK